MELTEFRDKKAQCERRMAEALATIVQEFRAETGVSPESVRVNMVEIGTLGDQFSNCAVGSVEIQTGI